jgi:hypothetical protein
VFEISVFSRRTFDVALATPQFPLDAVASDDHADYLYRYLDNVDIRAKTIVKEFEYVDGDFLQDFASYYVSCFTPYDRYCNRVHFFSNEFSRSEFEAIISGMAQPKHLRRFRKSYLGFIVIKSLPDTIIGRTQLKTYGDDHGRRHYRAIVDYDVHLFGVSLRVRSLAFQEQDQVLSACATVALWSCFQKTSRLFGTPAPRPPKITMDATASFFDRRSFPSSGLYVEQICSAIRQNGLDPEVFGAAAMSEAPVASLIYGYVSVGLPVLLIVKVDDRGWHAVTVTGYSLRQELVHHSESLDESALPLIGRRIDEFYAHDDQHGPFARLKFVPATRDNNTPHFEGSWQRDDATPCELVPTQIIVPVYPKIRLAYLQALKWVNEINPSAQAVSQASGIGTLEWDVHLTTTNEYKTAIRRQRPLNERRLQYILTKQQPRFFWRCIARTEGAKPVFELLIDATGFAKSFPVLTLNYHDDTFAGILVAVTPASANLITSELRKLIHEEYRDRNGPVSKTAGTQA